MTKDVLISISGMHMMNGDTEDISVIAAGDYYYKNGKHYVIYEEVVEGFDTPIKNTIRITPDTVDILKRGSTSAHMVFERNKKNLSCYATPVGQMAVGINTKDIEVSENEDRLKVEVGYSLDINYQLVSDCRIVVDVQSKSTADFHLCS